MRKDAFIAEGVVGNVVKLETTLQLASTSSNLDYAVCDLHDILKSYYMVCDLCTKNSLN